MTERADIANRFQKGQSGNPKGPKPGLRRTVMELFEPFEPQCAANIQKFILDDSNPNLQWEVTKYVVERIHGKPVERKEVTGKDGAPIAIEHSPIALLLQQMLSAKDVEPVKVIDVETDPKD